jgi:hypothetical protein
MLLNGEMGKRVRAAKKPLMRSARLWIPVGVSLAILLAAGLLALNMVPKGLQVKNEIEAALPLASRMQVEILAGDSAAATATTVELKGHTSKARAGTRGMVWSAMEHVPFVGPNLEALRVISETVDDLVTDALVPASAISIDSLKPVDGRFDVAALQEVGDLLTTMIASVDIAIERLGDLKSDVLVPQLGSGLGKLAATLEKARPILSQVQQPLSVLPDALGASGARNYLMIFQGNSEMRASGGNPAAMTMLSVVDGKIDIAQQATSVQFSNNRPESVVPLDPETNAIYSDIIGKWIPNITGTPHFPTTVELVKAFWADEFGSETKIDGVISFDPVGLSYLLGATGPVTVATGEQLTAQNAVPLLLNEVYFRYETGMEQDVFFAGAAVSIFDALKSGTGDTKHLMNALVKSVDEGRLKMWSANEAEQELIAGTALEGSMPADNVAETALGVYFNDTTGSKMDYYVDAAVTGAANLCEVKEGEAPVFSADVTLTNNITRETAAELPDYITGVHYEPGNIATDFVVYGPVGAAIDSWLVNGKEYPALRQGIHLGRPVVRLNYVLPPGASVTVSYTMTGAVDVEHGPLKILTTPMVRPTPVTMSSPGCK